MADLDGLIATFLRSFENRSAEERTRIAHALEMAIEAHRDQKRADGAPYVTHVIAVAEILRDWGADTETVIAGLLHDALEDSSITHHAVRQAFGRRVSALVEGVTKFTQADFEDSAMDRKIETLRKLFEVMRSDIRVILIKLADRLHNIRTIGRLPSDRSVLFARETMEIYYKLAYHLGLSDTRREFSEICMPILHPEEIAEIARQRESALPHWRSIREEAEREIRQHDTEGLLLSIDVRPRSLHSLYANRSQNIDKNPHYLVAIVPDTSACYRFLQLLHTIFRPISGTFRDMIAAPTESGYQSLHTLVVGPGGERVQVRIRTPAMEEFERKGVLLKLFGKQRKALPGFSWLDRSETLDIATRESSAGFWEALQTDILQESFAVTIDSQQLRIPRGATALDAAYARHGIEGNRTKHCMVNGTVQPPGFSLSEDDVVQVALDGFEHVRFDWLSSVATRYARGIIVDALKRRDQSEKLALGQRLLQQEFDRFQKGFIGELGKAQHQEIAAHYRRGDFNDVLAMIGEGVLRPTDVFFVLFPDQHRRRIWSRTSTDYPFRLRVIGTLDRNRDPYATVGAVAAMHGTRIAHANLKTDEGSGTFALTVRGRSESRLQFVDFLGDLEKNESISRVQTLLSQGQRLRLVGISLIAFGVMIIDVLLLPFYSEGIRGFPVAVALFLYALPLIPILVINFYLLTVLQHYIVALRRDRWFLGIGFMLNGIGLLLVIIRSTAVQTQAPGLLPFIAVFVLSMFLLGYRMLQNEQVYTSIRAKKYQPPTIQEWQEIRRRRTIGYTFRIFAVIIWGLQPLYLKYTPAGQVHPVLLVYLMSAGLLLATLVGIGGQALFSLKRIPLRIPWNIHLINVIIGQALFLYFIGSSLRITSSTNFALLSNFSPVIALLVATVLWRHQIPYLRDPKHVLWIFAIFLMGSTGSSLIIYNSIVRNAATVQGDVLALLAMVCDVLLITAQIRYIKLVPTASPMVINLYISALLVVGFFPIFIALWLSGSSLLTTVTTPGILFSLGAGVQLAIGIVFNFEAFRRIDGFIAFLMFNVSILINFVGEVMLLGTVKPTILFLIGATIIVASTILAEWINSHCEKKGT